MLSKLCISASIAISYIRTQLFCLFKTSFAIFLFVSPASLFHQLQFTTLQSVTGTIVKCKYIARKYYGSIHFTQVLFVWYSAELHIFIIKFALNMYQFQHALLLVMSQDKMSSNTTNIILCKQRLSSVWGNMRCNVFKLLQHLFELSFVYQFY